MGAAPVLASGQSWPATSSSAACWPTSCGPYTRRPLARKEVQHAARAFGLVPRAASTGRQGPAAASRWPRPASSCEGFHDSGAAPAAGAPLQCSATTVTVVAPGIVVVDEARNAPVPQHGEVAPPSCCVRGKGSQIWNSSSGLGAVAFSSGNISECTMPLALQ